jgi:hypothetical protein
MAPLPLPVGAPIARRDTLPRIVGAVLGGLEMRMPVSRAISPSEATLAGIRSVDERLG